MNGLTRRLSSLGLVLSLVALFAATTNGQVWDANGPDLVITGPILTLDTSRPRATGMIIHEGIIRQVTTAEIARAAAGPNTNIIVVPTRGAAMPGIVESHAHLLGVGQRSRTLDLRGARSPEDVAALVKEAAKSVPEGGWIEGRGWNQELWANKSFPNRSQLDAVTQGKPCFLTRVDGHAAWVNSAALDRAGIREAGASPSGGEVLVDKAGAPSGVLIDNAMDLVTKVMPSNETPEQIDADFLAAQEVALSHGITTFVDAGTGPKKLLRLAKLYFEKQMKLRVYSMFGVSSEEDLQQALKTPPIKTIYDDRTAVRALKLYADGALGSRGAWLTLPYTDRPDHVGLPVMRPEFIERAAKAALVHGWQICVHAIGDRAVHETLNAFERALKAATPAQRLDPRFRIEHAQLVNPVDIKRFRQLKVIPSMQGCHCTSDGAWAPKRIGAQRAAKMAYVWRKFLDAGCIIANGTDAPVEGLSPWKNLFSTVTRFMVNDKGEYSPFFPRQRMNRLEALQSMTTWGAIATFSEDRRGKLRPGMQADIVVLDRDPLTCNIWHLGRARPLFTIIAGEIVWMRPR